jgi:membrane-associated HD superfamily phosphohydrolase
MNSHCLNCDRPLAGNYCATCGQKASTHRYSLQHFIEHDFIHGVWHVDKGIFFTLRALFTRPGHSIREYIEGKRVNYFPFVTLIVLILAISALLAPYSHIKLADLMPEASKAMTNSFESFATKYPKIILLIAIPVNSLFSFIWFRKAKFNYSEHLVLNSYKTAAELIFGLTFSIIAIFYTNISVLSLIYFVLSGGVGIIYGVWFYYQFFSKSVYSKKGVLIRSISIPLSYMVLSLVIGFLWGMFQRLQH